MDQIGAKRLAEKPDFFHGILGKQVARLNGLQQAMFTDANLNPRPEKMPSHWAGVVLMRSRKRGHYIKRATQENKSWGLHPHGGAIWMVEESVVQCC